MFHLLGLRVTQVVNGSAVVSLPLSPWLMHPDGVLEIGLLADVACGIAADTVLEPGAMIVPLDVGYRPLRRVDEQARWLVARAHVIRSSSDWVYVEGQVEDGQGRAVAHVSAHAAVQPVRFQVPDEVSAFETVELPSYPTQDPHRRPLPPEKQAVIAQFHEHGCVATFRAIADGDAPLPPLYSLLGVRPVEASEGAVTTELVTSGWVRSVDPTNLNGAYLRTQAVSTGAAAIWTLAPSGHWPAILNFHTLFVDSAPADGRRIQAHATAEHHGQNLVHATVVTSDGTRRLAVSHLSAQLRGTARPLRPRRSRALATVLFTDLVDSTAAAKQLGDERWRQLLERHERLLRHHLDDHGGRQVKMTGDGLLATFDSPTAAVECACAIRDDVQRLGLEVRAGVHTGEVEMIGGDIAGITVHVAARIEAVAMAGQVWVSGTVRSLTHGSGLGFKDEGTHGLKGVDERMQLYSVVA